jgi:hypothetical protein
MGISAMQNNPGFNAWNYRAYISSLSNHPPTKIGEPPVVMPAKKVPLATATIDVWV